MNYCTVSSDCLIYRVQQKRRGCLLSYSQAEPERELTQPSPRLLAEPCKVHLLARMLGLLCLCAYFQFLLVNEIMLPLLTLHLVYMIYSHLL